jgi:hypothetical protein
VYISFIVVFFFYILNLTLDYHLFFNPSIRKMSVLTRLTLSSPSALCRLGQLLANRQIIFQQQLPVLSMASSLMVPSQRTVATSAIRRDIDSAAKYIGAGAATVGVAGAGAGKNFLFFLKRNHLFDFIFRYWNSIWFISSSLCT